MKPAQSPCDAGQGEGSADDGNAVFALVLGGTGHLAWIIPMLGGSALFGLAAGLVPLIGLPITIFGMLYAVKGLKGRKRGLAIVGLLLCIIGFMLCIGAVVSLPGPLRRYLP